MMADDDDDDDYENSVAGLLQRRQEDQINSEDCFDALMAKLELQPVPLCELDPHGIRRMPRDAYAWTILGAIDYHQDFLSPVTAVIELDICNGSGELHLEQPDDESDDENEDNADNNDRNKLYWLNDLIPSTKIASISQGPRFTTLKLDISPEKRKDPPHEDPTAEWAIQKVTKTLEIDRRYVRKGDLVLQIPTEGDRICTYALFFTNDKPGEERMQDQYIENLEAENERLKGLLKQAEQERDEAVRRNERPKRNRE
jgi:hypothetical protein